MQNFHEGSVGPLPAESQTKLRHRPTASDAPASMPEMVPAVVDAVLRTAYRRHGKQKAVRDAAARCLG